MVATKYDKKLQANLIENNALKNDKLLRFASIYGANASGKTNVIYAMNTLRRMVTRSHLSQRGDDLPAEQFKLDDSYINKPVSFEIVFIQNDIKYIYSIKFLKDKIVSESLYHYPKGIKAILFERNINNEKIYKFTKDKKVLSAISSTTLDNALFLSMATKSGYEPISVVFDWFKDKFATVGPANGPAFNEYTIDLLNKNETYKKRIIDSLKSADLGIYDVKGSVKTISMDEIRKIGQGFISVEIKGEVDKDINNLDEMLLKSINKNKDKELKTQEIITYHRVEYPDGIIKNIQFDMEDESQGTQRLFSLLGIWIDALENGKILILDELDIKLHHLLIILLIKMFQKNESYKAGQLIFTTHNVCLLDEKEIFRRDQIWFTQKDYKSGATQLYSLVEFKLRNDKRILKDYLLGRYGALPFITNGC